MLSSNSNQIQKFFSRYKKTKNSTKFCTGPFLLFCQGMRNKGTEKKGVFVLAELWNNLDDNQKKEYYAIYKKEKEKKQREDEEVKQNNYELFLEKKKGDYLSKYEDKKIFEQKSIEAFLESEKNKELGLEASQKSNHYKENDGFLFLDEESNKQFNLFEGKNNSTNHCSEIFGKENLKSRDDEKKKKKMIEFLKDCERFVAIKRKIEKNE
jgi:uncharacterized membrane protein